MDMLINIFAILRNAKTFAKTSPMVIYDRFKMNLALIIYLNISICLHHTIVINNI